MQLVGTITSRDTITLGLVAKDFRVDNGWMGIKPLDVYEKGVMDNMGLEGDWPLLQHEVAI